jgi:hypothetical protein
MFLYPLRRLVLFCCISLVPFSTYAEQSKPPVKERFHIYLLIGDGEMVGTSELAEGGLPAIERCFVLNDKEEWEPAKASLNRYSSIRRVDDKPRLGPAYYFAKEMLAQNADISVGLVVNAGKDWDIDKWGPKSPAYRGARGRTKKAMQKGVVKGVLWKSKPTKTDAPIALDYLKDIIAALRADLRLLDLPVVVGELSHSSAYNTQLKALQEDVHGIGIAADSKDIQALGNGFATEMIKLQNRYSQNYPSPSIPLIDTHVHARDVNQDGLEALNAWMTRNNIDVAISHPLRQSKFKTAQEREQMLANYAKYKGRIYRFCLVEPTDVESVEEAVRILEKEKASGAIGMGEHYGHDLMFDDPKNMMLYAACEKVGFPVMFHIDRTKNMDERGLPRVERVLQKFPECKLLAHAAWWSHLPD